MSLVGYTVTATLGAILAFAVCVITAIGMEYRGRNYNSASIRISWLSWFAVALWLWTADAALWYQVWRLQQ